MTFGRFQRASEEDTVSFGVSGETPPVVVVIDDDLDIREGLESELRKTYTVRLAANAEEGIQAVDHDARAVILDIKMPGKDGFQVYTELKANFPELPVIFYSAYQDILESAKFSMRYQPFSFLDKGDDLQELLHILELAVRYSSDL